MRARTAFALVVALALAGVAHADRETALFSAGRGDKALAAKKWDEAETHYRKAIEEDETFLPARYGLAQALVGAGKSAPAIEVLRKFVDDAHAETAPMPADWKALVAKAEKQLTDLDAAGAALQKIQNAYVEQLVDFAQRWLAKDPVTAETALRRVLKMHPGHPKAVQLLEKAGRSTANEIVELIDGKSTAGWDGAEPPTWSITDGNLQGHVQTGAYFARTLRTFDGDFIVRCEARVLDEYAQPVFFAMQVCGQGDHDYYSLGVLRGKLVWSDEQGPDKGRDIVSIPPTDLKQQFDPRQWNTYEVRVSGKSSVALVNGEEIGHEERPEWRKGGFLGLKVQDVKVQFRKIQVEMK
jgi:tetratricopeptide (TPR) repeat protein